MIRSDRLLLAAYFLCLLTFTSTAAAQMETRSTSRVVHEPCGIAAADFRNSGIQDLAVALDSVEIQVLLGNGDGTFQKPATYPAGDGVNWVATGILTSSGHMDIVVANRLSNFVTVLLGNGDGTFQAGRSVYTPASPSFVAIGDFNGDQIPDVVVADSPYITVLPGRGDGTFGRPVSTDLKYVPGGFAVGDFDKDGVLDLATGAELGGTNALVILLGKGNGTFRQGQKYSFSSGVGIPVTADFRGNGNLDLALAEGAAVQVLLGNGDGSFEAPVTYSTPSFVGAIILGDFNSDGKPDMAAVGFNPSGIYVILGDGDGTFQPPIFYPVGSDACYAAVADFNGDHQADLAVTDNLYERVTALLNTGTVSLSPAAEVVFPDQLVGTASAPQTVTLTNSGGSALGISSITASSQYSANSTCGKSVAPGASCSINITFMPTTQGTKTGIVSIIDTASTKPQAIELTGAGTVVTLSPASLEFGPQKVGTSSEPQQVQLKNNGSVPLSISKMALHGLNPYDFSENSNCPASLSAGETCIINITFTPLRAGSRSSILYVIDNGGGTPQTIQIAGTGSE